jgi:hypothetical protein
VGAGWLAVLQRVGGRGRIGEIHLLAIHVVPCLEDLRDGIERVPSAEACPRAGRPGRRRLRGRQARAVALRCRYWRQC